MNFNFSTKDDKYILTIFSGVWGIGISYDNKLEQKTIEPKEDNKKPQSTAKRKSKREKKQ